MKVKTSYSAMTSYLPLTIGVGYCELHYLLRNLNPLFYSSGHLGWNCDFYDLMGIGIATGYRLPSKAKKIPYELIDHYESRAMKVRNKDELELLQSDFVKEVYNLIKGN